MAPFSNEPEKKARVEQSVKPQTVSTQAVPASASPAERIVEQPASAHASPGSLELGPIGLTL